MTEGINLLELIGKKFDVPETNTKHYGPTLAEKQKALKKQPDYSIKRRRPRLAVGDKAPTQDSPAK